MAIKRTPPIGTEGRYTLISPFVASAGKTYTCMAIRSFDDIYEQEEDVFEDYYEGKGIENEQTVFDADRELGANIITLMDGEGEVIYVPDTFIESYPLMGNISYMHTVISVDLGALPEYINLDFTCQQILNAVTDLVNPPSPNVHVNRAPSSGFVSPADHETWEATRVSGIVNRTTDYAQVLALQALVDEQNAVIQTLQQIILDAGLIQPEP